MKLCTWHDSCTVISCAKFCRDFIPYNGVTSKLIFHGIWVNDEKKSFMKWAPGFTTWHWKHHLHLWSVSCNSFHPIFPAGRIWECQLGHPTAGIRKQRSHCSAGCGSRGRWWRQTFRSHEPPQQGRHDNHDHPWCRYRHAEKAFHQKGNALYEVLENFFSLSRWLSLCICLKKLISCVDIEIYSDSLIRMRRTSHFTVNTLCPESIQIVTYMWPTSPPNDASWRHRSESTSAQVMTCWLIAPSHYMNQCWLLTSDVLWHSPESNFIVNAQASVLYNGFENYTFQITVTYARDQ